MDHLAQTPEPQQEVDAMHVLQVRHMEKHAQDREVKLVLVHQPDQILGTLVQVAHHQLLQHMLATGLQQLLLHRKL